MGDRGAESEFVETDVVVVGAGLAGLTAARRLVADGLDVVVVEARDRVGGRLLDHTLADGSVVEVGGQWVGPGQHRIHALLDELGLATHPTWTRGDSLVGLGGDLRRYRGPYPRLSPFVLADVLQAQTRLDRQARRVPLDAPWEAPDAERLDRMTWETWIRRSTFTRAGAEYLRTVADAVFAAEPTSFSALHALFYVHSGTGVDALLSTRGGAQQDRVVGGTQLIAVRMAASLGDRVRLGHPVRSIAHGPAAGGGVEVRADGLVVRARRAIVAVPPTLAGRIAYAPALPADRDQLTQRMPAGAVIKTMAVYETPFWRDDGLNGQAATDRPPVKVTFDNSPPSGTPGVLLAFVEGRSAIELGRLGPDDRRGAVLGALVHHFGPRAAHPVEFVAQDWQAEEWTRGCYGAHLPPGAWTQLGPALTRPCGPLHWAGAETGTVWSGYMDGAVESGERTADEIRRILRP
ncbi:flavin monoamine oxidase family protein [Rhabdothermincola salaria]|uniref:flavin monoamine oxidase family protein n=1 Tax=Rhabdothermincola salaria TaxID=2903142 RepID=UPI001E4F9BAF|nr:flavin monoamine oxidase family protein [Rhabdothermincola salaria]MCD9624432.1 flavin monoamine oxidase family protein [Rhabdothermincola salaria]